MVRLFHFLKRWFTVSDLAVDSRLQKGKLAERVAAKFLRKQGLRLRAARFRCVFGEIDLIMQDNEILVFVEVRFRAHNRYGTAKETVDFTKQQKIIKSACYYLRKHRLSEQMLCRFDVVALNGDLHHPHVEWVKHAFQL